MNHRLLALLLSSILAVSLSGCADDDDDDPITVVVPDPGNDGQGDDDDDDDGNGNNTDAPWAIIRYERDRDDDQVCVLQTRDILIVQDNGRFVLETCQGVRTGRLSRSSLNQLRRDARRWIASDEDRKICAEASPQRESEVRMLLDTGEDQRVYEEDTEQGLCSYGNRASSLAIYQFLRRIWDRYQ